MTHFQSKEVYFDQNLELFGQGMRFTIRAGHHIFPFKFKLPNHLPSTFNGKHGSVQYKMKCTLTRGKDEVTETGVDLVILSIYNLNIVTSARRSIQVNRCKQVGVDNDLGTVSVCINIPKTGYVPGETICFNAEVINDSLKPLKKVQVRVKPFSMSSKSLG